MILVLLAISIAMLIGSIMWLKDVDYDSEDFACFLTGISAILTIGCIIALVCIGVGVKNTTYIDDKIAVLETENAEIEQELAAIINEYKQYEEGIYEPIKAENATTLIQLYPNLKANTLVEKQLQIHIDNQEQIKQLKVDKISRRAYNWWLYFG